MLCTQLGRTCTAAHNAEPRLACMQPNVAQVHLAYSSAGHRPVSLPSTPSLTSTRALGPSLLPIRRGMQRRSRPKASLGSASSGGTTSSLQRRIVGAGFNVCMRLDAAFIPLQLHQAQPRARLTLTNLQCTRPIDQPCKRPCQASRPYRGSGRPSRCGLASIHTRRRFSALSFW